MGTAEDKDRQILILCEEKLRPLYALQIGNLEEEGSFAFEFANDAAEFKLRCLQSPPSVGLVDLASVIRGKTEDMNRLFSFRVRWPVLRCKVGSDGNGQVMRANPPLKGDFHESLLEMVAGDSRWNLPDETRSHLRSNVRCRGLIRTATGDNAQQVNVQTVSRAGCLILTIDPPQPGSEIELEIRDLPTGPATILARVAWTWQWDSTTEVPRAGIEFNQQQLPAEYIEALANPEFFSELC